MKVFKNTRGDWDWSKFAIAIMTLITLPLVGLLYNNIVKAIDVNKAEAKEVSGLLAGDLKQKVDNATLLRYLDMQKEQSNLQIQQQKEQTDVLRKQLKQQQEDGKDIMKVIQKLNVNMILLQKAVGDREE